VPDAEARAAPGHVQSQSRNQIHPKFLHANDVVRLGIDGLGEQQQKFVKFKA